MRPSYLKTCTVSDIDFFATLSPQIFLTIDRKDLLTPISCLGLLSPLGTFPRFEIFCASELELYELGGTVVPSMYRDQGASIAKRRCIIAYYLIGPSRATILYADVFILSNLLDDDSSDEEWHSLLGEPLINPDPVTVSLEGLQKGDFKVSTGKLATLIEGDEALQLHFTSLNMLNTSLAEGYRRDAPCPGFNIPRSKVSRHCVTSTRIYRSKPTRRPYFPPIWILLVSPKVWQQ